MNPNEISARLELLKTGKHSDVTITVTEGIQREQYKCHKVILATKSQQLEDRIGDKNEIVLVDTDPELFYCLLYYMYTGRIKTVPLQKLGSLFSCAWGYEVQKFEKIYQNEMMINFEFLLYYLEYSRLIRDYFNEKRCEFFIQSQTKMVLKKNAIECVSPTIVLWLLDQEHLNIKTDMNLFIFLARYRDEAKPSEEFMETAKKKIRYLNMQENKLIRLNESVKILNERELNRMKRNFVALKQGGKLTLPAGFTKNVETRSSRFNQVFSQ